MFNRKIVPDFTPRKSVAQKPTVYSAPLQQETSLPTQILISESQKIPYIPPPKIPERVYERKVEPVIQFMSEKMVPHTTPSLPPQFLGPTQNAAPASFSPNLETFTGTDNPYFATIADIPDPAKWSLYPAISTINMADYDIINGNSLTFSTITSFSTVSQVLDLDGNNLTTAGQELLFNGQPLATVSSITSNVAGWSLFPAISTIIVDSNAITGVTNIQLSSINGQIYPPPIPLSTWVSTATSQLDMSNYGITNISSLTGVSSINGSVYPPTSPSSWVSTATSALDMGPYNIAVSSITGISSLNGTAFPGPVADVSLWADYVASSNVTIPNKDLNMTTTTAGISYNTANLNANVNIGNLANAPLRPDFNAYCGNVTFGGLTTPLTTMTVNSIGGINLTSATGVNVTGGGTVTVSGGGGVAVSGGGGVTVGGGGGVAITGAGAISVAAGGVSVAGGGVAITAGGLAINAGLTEIGTIGGPGGGLNIFGSDINMIPVGAITAEIYTEYLKSHSGTNTMQITGVSTINGSVYPPTGPGAGVTSLNTLSGVLNLVAGTGISVTPGVSTITIANTIAVISERATSVTPITLTATTFGTAQTILSFTITPTVVSDINVTCSFTYQTNSNTVYDIIYYAQIDGVQIGVTMRNSINGVGHFANVSILGSAISQSAALHTVTIKAYAGSAPAAGNLTVTAVSAYAMANLV